MRTLMQDIVVIDDDAFTRAGLTTYLQSLGYTPRTAGDVQTAWDMVLTRPPQTAVIDIRLPLSPADIGRLTPEPHGLALTLRLKASFPTMSLVLFSAHQEYEREVIEMSQRFMRSIAFLHKGGDMNRLELAIQEVQSGRTVFQSDLVNRYVLETAVRSHFASTETYWIDQALSCFASLSPRETEIAHLLSAAFTPETIAHKLNLTKGSVDNVISRIYTKLGLTDMKQDENGLRPLPILIKTCLVQDIRAQ